MRIHSTYSPAAVGPFSAVRSVQPSRAPKAESAGPIEELTPSDSVESPRPFPGSSMSASQMAEQGQRTAGQTLAAFPQVVHILANPELHIGQTLSRQLGLPVISLESVPVQELNELLRQPEYSEGFILEGFPADRGSAESLDGLLSATDPNERRVLGWQAASTAEQEIVDHYVDAGLMWVVPQSQDKSPAQVNSSVLECLVGLPALH